MKVIKLSLVVVLFLATAVCVRAGSVDVLKKTYDDKSFKIVVDYNEAKKGLVGKYIKELNYVQGVLMKAGDPGPVLKAKEVHNKAVEDKSIPKKPEKGVPDIVGQIQKKYAKSEVALELERNKSILHLTKLYISALDRDMRKLTGNGDLEGAMEFKDEKERVGFIVADMQSKLKKEQPVVFEPLGKWLVGTKWAHEGGTVREFRKDGTIFQKEWNKKGIKTGWKVVNSNTVVLKILKGPLHGKGDVNYSTLKFSDNRESFSGINFNKQPLRVQKRIK